MYIKYDNVQVLKTFSCGRLYITEQHSLSLSSYVRKAG